MDNDGDIRPILDINVHLLYSLEGVIGILFIYWLLLFILALHLKP